MRVKRPMSPKRLPTPPDSRSSSVRLTTTSLRHLAAYRYVLDVGIHSCHDAKGTLAPSVLECIEDLLRVDEVQDAYRSAVTADRDVAGEADRIRLRAVARNYLDRASAEHDRELARRRAAAQDPHPVNISELGDPSNRRQTYARASSNADHLASLREERLAIRQEAAEKVGAGSPFDLLAAEQPIDIAQWAAEVEQVLIEPLDERVASWAQERRLRSRLP